MIDQIIRETEKIIAKQTQETINKAEPIIEKQAHKAIKEAEPIIERQVQKTIKKLEPIIEKQTNKIIQEVKPIFEDNIADFIEENKPIIENQANDIFEKIKPLLNEEIDNIIKIKSAKIVEDITEVIKQETSIIIEEQTNMITNQFTEMIEKQAFVVVNQQFLEIRNKLYIIEFYNFQKTLTHIDTQSNIDLRNLDWELNSFILPLVQTSNYLKNLVVIIENYKKYKIPYQFFNLLNDPIKEIFELSKKITKSLRDLSQGEYQNDNIELSLIELKTINSNSIVIQELVAGNDININGKLEQTLIEKYVEGDDYLVNAGDITNAQVAVGSNNYLTSINNHKLNLGE